MRSAANAYERISKQTATPRELEAGLLLKAASQLQLIRDDWDGKRQGLEQALLYNRKLWSLFMSSAASPDNPLPRSIRENVANLGLFVMKQTVSVTAQRRPEGLNSLININRELAAGLLSRA
jgi:flagellar biosynthesis activator protein FlaF